LPDIELFFDRTVGKSIPVAMRSLGLAKVYYHHIYPKQIDMEPIKGQKGLFRHDERDDVWLTFVGKRGWFVIGQDHSYHLELAELTAIRDHKIGVFYIWGAEEKKWDTMRYLARVYPAILSHAETTDRPFIFKVGFNGKFRKIL
jgi:PIN like domain